MSVPSISPSTAAACSSSHQEAFRLEPFIPTSLEELVRRIEDLTVDHELLLATQSGLMPISIDANRIVRVHLPSDFVGSIDTARAIKSALTVIKQKRNELIPLCDVVRSGSIPPSSTLSQLEFPPEILQSILSNLEIPDLVPFAQVNSTCRCMAINSYFREQRELFLHAIDFWAKEIESCDSSGRYVAVVDGLRRLFTFVQSVEHVGNFRAVQTLHEYTRDQVISLLKTIDDETLKKSQKAWKYERKPQLLVPFCEHLVAVFQEYRIMDSRILGLPTTSSDIHAQMLTIMEHVSWRSALTLAKKIPDEDEAIRTRALQCVIEFLFCEYDSRKCHRIRTAFQLARELQNENYDVQFLRLRCDDLREPERCMRAILENGVLRDTESAEFGRELVSALIFGRMCDAVNAAKELLNAYVDWSIIERRDSFVARQIQALQEELCDQGLLSQIIELEKLTKKLKMSIPIFPIMEYAGKHFARQGFMGKALEMAQNCSYPLNKRYLRSSIIYSLLLRGELRKAETLLLKENNENRRNEEAMQQLSEAYQLQGLIDDALRIALLMIHLDSWGFKEERLTSLAQLYIHQRQYDKAFDAVYGLGHYDYKNLRKQLVQIHLTEGRFSEALRIAKALPCRFQDEMLLAISEKFLATGNLENAQEIASQLSSPYDRSIMLGKILLKQFPNVDKVSELFSMLDMESLPDDMRDEICRNMDMVQGGTKRRD